MLTVCQIHHVRVVQRNQCTLDCLPYPGHVNRISKDCGAVKARVAMLPYWITFIEVLDVLDELMLSQCLMKVNKRQDHRSDRFV